MDPQEELDELREDADWDEDDFLQQHEEDDGDYLDRLYTHEGVYDA